MPSPPGSCGAQQRCLRISYSSQPLAQEGGPPGKWLQSQNQLKTNSKKTEHWPKRYGVNWEVSLKLEENEIQRTSVFDFSLLLCYVGIIGPSKFPSCHSESQKAQKTQSLSFSSQMFGTKTHLVVRSDQNSCETTYNFYLSHQMGKYNCVWLRGATADLLGWCDRLVDTPIVSLTNSWGERPRFETHQSPSILRQRPDDLQSKRLFWKSNERTRVKHLAWDLAPSKQTSPQPLLPKDTAAGGVGGGPETEKTAGHSFEEGLLPWRSESNFP